MSHYFFILFVGMFQAMGHDEFTTSDDEEDDHDHDSLDRVFSTLSDIWRDIRYASPISGVLDNMTGVQLNDMARATSSHLAPWRRPDPIHRRRWQKTQIKGEHMFQKVPGQVIESIIPELKAWLRRFRSLKPDTPPLFDWLTIDELVIFACATSSIVYCRASESMIPKQSSPSF